LDVRDEGSRSNKTILSIEIHRDGIDGKFWVITMRVHGMILRKFSMNDVKPVKYFLAFHYKFSLGLCPSDEEEKGYMSHV
jgi:hypothetical protein